MIMLLLALACGADKEEDTLPEVQPDTGGFCADAPVLTWNNFGQGLLIEHCQACHAAEATYRDGDNPPPANVFFDTHEDAITWRDRILAVTTGDDPIMPPRGGLSELDRQRIEIWLVCGEED